MEYKRDEKIDILKALAIILMVVAHAGFKYKGVINMFHMSIFIMASGYCFKEHSVDNLQGLKNYVARKLISLYIPYVVFNFVFILFYNKFIDWHIYTNNADISSPRVRVTWDEIFNTIINLLHFEPSANQQLCGAAWFVIVLFYISVGFALLYYIANMFSGYVKHIIIIFSAIVMLYFGNYLNEMGIFLQGYASPAFTGYTLYVLGYYINKMPKRTKENIENIDIIICLFGWPLIMFMWENFGGISIGNNEYPSVGILLVCAILGWLWIITISNIIKNLKLGKPFEYVGKRTLFILFLHFISFKLVTIIQICIYGYKWDYLASFPVLRSDPIWVVVYSIVGLIVPLIIEFIYQKTKQSIKKKCYNID